MGRFRAGLITGVTGGVVISLLGLLQSYSFSLLGFILAIVIGIFAGSLVARNTSFAGKTGHAGALAGLIAGVFLLIGQIVAGVVFFNSPNGQTVITSLQQTVAPTLTAIATNGGGSSTASPATYITAAAGIGITFVECIVGLLDIGLATAVGAIAGAITGRKNQPPAPQMMPYGYPQVPGYPPVPGYQPPVYPQPPMPPTQGGYGSATIPQQPGYPPPQNYQPQQPVYPPPPDQSPNQ